MAATDRITMNVGTHGQFQTDARRFDYLLDLYDGDQVYELKEHIEAMSPEIDYSDLITRTECLMILAELHGFATN